MIGYEQLSRIPSRLWHQVVNGNIYKRMSCVDCSRGISKGIRFGGCFTRRRSTSGFSPCWLSLESHSNHCPNVHVPYYRTLFLVNAFHNHSPWFTLFGKSQAQGEELASIRGWARTLLPAVGVTDGVVEVSWPGTTNGKDEWRMREEKQF